MAKPGKKRYCVFGCTELGAYMHGFPHPERRPELFKTWISIVGDKLKETDPLRIYKNKKICDHHFTSHQKVASHRLIHSAVPSVNLNGVHISPGISVQLEHSYCIPGVYYDSTSSSFQSKSAGSTDKALVLIRLDPSLDFNNQPSTSQANFDKANKYEQQTKREHSDHTYFQSEEQAPKVARLTGVAMHTFPHPVNFPESFKAWVEVVGGKLETPNDYAFYRKKMICDIHFVYSHKNRNHRLNALAVPTLCLPDKSSKTRQKASPSGKAEETSHTGETLEETTLSVEAVDETVLSGEAVEETTLSAEVVEETLLFGEAVEDYWQDSAVTDETEEALNPEFSWQQESAVVPCDDDHPERLPPPAPCLGSPPHDAAAEDEKLPLDLTNYQCNFCSNIINGFRYTCVQCLDVDLCGVCEARQAHHMHYVLRIPHNRPQAEVAARLRVIRQALLANAIVNVPGDLSEDMVEVKEEQNQEDHTDVVLYKDDTDAEMYPEDPIDVMYPDQAELEKKGLAVKDPMDVNLDFDLSLRLGQKDLVKEDPLDSASEDGASDLENSHEETFSELSKQTDTQTITVKRQAIRHKSTSSAVKPLRTSLAKTQANSVKKLPLFIPTNSQQLFTIQTTQSKSSTDTILRITPASRPAVDPNRSIVTLDRMKEELLSERLKPEIIQRHLTTQRLGLEPISTANKRYPERSLLSREVKKIKTHHKTESSNSLQHMDAAVVSLERLPARFDPTEQQDARRTRLK